MPRSLSDLTISNYRSFDIKIIFLPQSTSLYSCVRIMRKLAYLLTLLLLLFFVTYTNKLSGESNSSPHNRFCSIWKLTGYFGTTHLNMERKIVQNVPAYQSLYLKLGELRNKLMWEHMRIVSAFVYSNNVKLLFH